MSQGLATKQQRWKHIALCELSVGAEWRQRGPGLVASSEMIRTAQQDTWTLVSFLRHYHFIVYLGFSLWRKLMILHADSSNSASNLPQYKKGTQLMGPSQAGLLGCLNRLPRFIPKLVLQERRALKNQHDLNSAIQDAETTKTASHSSMNHRSFGEFVNAAVRNNQQDVVHILLVQFHVDPNTVWEGTYSNLLQIAVNSCARSSGGALIKMLVQKGADINITTAVSNDSVLMMAAARGFTDAVEAIVAAGGDVNERHAKTGRSPLHCAVQGQHVATAKFLLGKGAKVDATSSKYQGSSTPLYFASKAGLVEMMELFLANEADVDKQDTKGGSSLMIAAAEGQLEACQLLLQKGASANLKDQSDWNALHHAASGGHEEVVALLISKGADAAAKEDNRGRTPKELAKAFHYREMIEHLESRGVNW